MQFNLKITEMIKKLCSIHHLYYNGDVCPMCISEKYDNLYNNSVHKNRTIQSTNGNNIVSEETLLKLKAKFSK